MGLLPAAAFKGSFDEIMPGWASPPVGYFGKSATDVPVTTDVAMRISVAWSCIRLLAGTLAKVPLHLFRNTPDGKEPAKDRPEYPVLHDRVSPSMTSYAWRRAAMVHCLTWGNSYSERVLDGYGRLVELNLMRPDRMERVVWTNGQRVYHYRNGDGRRLELRQEQVFHIPGMGFDGLVGYPVLSLMRETVGSYASARDYGAAVFRNGARPSVVVTHPKTMSDPAVERLGAQMDRLRGSGNAGKTVIIEEGGDFKDLGFTPEDAQFIQTKEFELGELARWYGVPPHMVGLVDRSTSWGSGIEEQTLGFLTFTMDDWFVNFEQEFRAQLFWDTDIFAEFNRDAMLRTDALKRAQTLDIQRRNGVVSADEWRSLENRNPLPDGLGETYLRPVNMTVVATYDGTTTRTELEEVSKSIVTLEQVLAKKAELEAAGQPAGHASLAKALNVSESTVRRRLAEMSTVNTPE